MIRKELRDQSAHVAWCLLTLAPAVLWPGLLTCALSGFMAGLIREVTEEGTPVTPAKVWRAVRVSKLDLTFWAVGGVVLGLMV